MTSKYTSNKKRENLLGCNIRKYFSLCLFYEIINSYNEKTYYSMKPGLKVSIIFNL